MSANRDEFPEDRAKLKTDSKSRYDSRNKTSDMKFLSDTAAAPAPSGDSRASQAVPEIPYQFADPCPESMREVNITDLSAVNINWKMLTLARPKTKTDEEIFSK